MRVLASQADVCARYGVQPQLPMHHDRLGIAMATLGLSPINGMRILAMSGSSGWYVYGGAEAGTNDDFYSPLCVRHMAKHCEIVIPYLWLPAGWRFQIDTDDYEDVWYDESLLTSNH